MTLPRPPTLGTVGRVLSEVLYAIESGPNFQQKCKYKHQANATRAYP